MKITDEDVLNAKKISAQQAASYIGMTYPMLSWLMQEDARNGTEVIPFGRAVKHEGKNSWSYIIVPQRLYDYKHKSSINQQQYAELVKKLNEATDLMQNCVELMGMLVLKKGRKA